MTYIEVKQFICSHRTSHKLRYERDESGWFCEIAVCSNCDKEIYNGQVSEEVHGDLLLAEMNRASKERKQESLWTDGTTITSRTWDYDRQAYVNLTHEEAEHVLQNWHNCSTVTVPRELCQSQNTDEVKKYIITREYLEDASKNS
jgi:hypothetical protein